MKIFISVLLLSVSMKSSWALQCSGCEAKSAEDSCNFLYDCSEDSKYCEALVTKFEGNYSVIMSCATMEKCGTNSADQGLEKCDHLSSSTECFLCCEDNNCNALNETINKLPTDIFTYKDKSEKGFEEYEEKMLKDFEKIIEADEKILEQEEADDRREEAEKKLEEERENENLSESFDVTTETNNSLVADAVNSTAVESTELTEAVNETLTLVENVNFTSTTLNTEELNSTDEVALAVDSTETPTTLAPETTLTSSITTEAEAIESELEEDEIFEALPDAPVEDNSLVDPLSSTSSNPKQGITLVLICSVILICTNLKF